MAQAIQVSLDELGNIVLPADLGERLRLAPGMTLVVEKGEEGGLRLRIQSRPTVLVEKDGLLVAKVTASGNLANVVRGERDQRVLGLLQRVGL